MGKFYRVISGRISFAKELYFWGWRWVVFVIWGLPYGVGTFYDFLQGQGFLPSSSPILSNLIPTWLPPIWLIGGILAFIIITFEGTYRIVQKERNIYRSNYDTIDSFATLIKEADNLKIIWANNSTQELDAICDDAIIWTKKAIQDITNKLGAVVGKKIRVEAELPLNGEIKHENFLVPFPRTIHSDKLALVRDRQYKVYYWIRDFIENAPLNSDKGGSLT